MRRGLVGSGRRDAAGAAGVGQRDPSIGQPGDTALRFSARKAKKEKRTDLVTRKTRTVTEAMAVSF